MISPLRRCALALRLNLPPGPLMACACLPLLLRLRMPLSGRTSLPTGT